MTETQELKYQNLIDFIRNYKKVVVAFSGGVDSSFLLYAANQAIKGKVIAVTLKSYFNAEDETLRAFDFASEHNIEIIIKEEDQIDEIILENPKDRCYHCKKFEFSEILHKAKEIGAEVVFDGTNADDLSDYRPGLKALDELGILSPLKSTGFTKQDIRDVSKHFGLNTWNLPAFACLASRIPYGTRITPEKLSRVEKAEKFLFQNGFFQVRVRDHNGLARIEVAPEERRKFFMEAFMDEVSFYFKEIGFTYVSLELSGYKTGSLNKVISVLES